MKKVYVLILIYYVSKINLYGQDIARHYQLRFTKAKDTTEHYIQYDQLKIHIKNFPESYSYPPRKVYNVEDNFMYISLNNKKTDSLEFKKGSIFFPSYNQIISVDNKIFFEFQNFLYEVEKTKGKIIKKYLLNDSIMLYGQFRHFFFGDTEMRLYFYDVLTRQCQLIYNFQSVKDIGYDRYVQMGPEMPKPNISVHKPIIGKNKLLIGVYLEDPLFDYVFDLSTKQVEQIDSSKNYQQIGKAIANYCLSLPNYEMDKFNIDYNSRPFIQSYFLDITDTLAYINQTEVMIKYERKVIPQDAFVMNSDYKIIDRVLDRHISEYSMIYQKDKKKFVIASGDTDSTFCYFNIAIKYPLEKAFYNIYYNKELLDKELQGFDQYELLLLKNFIYAKYNYKFKNPFYEAYYNTFTFYHDFQTWDAGKKKVKRRKKVDNYFTKADNKNLTLILTKIK